MTVDGVAQEETVGFDGVGGEEETADGDDGEMVAAFEGGGFGVSASGVAVAHEQAGDAAFDQVLVEVRE